MNALAIPSHRLRAAVEEIHRLHQLASDPWDMTAANWPDAHLAINGGGVLRRLMHMLYNDVVVEDETTKRERTIKVSEEEPCPMC